MSIMDALQLLLGFVVGYIVVVAVVMIIFLGLSGYNDRENARTTGDSPTKRRDND